MIAIGACGAVFAILTSLWYLAYRWQERQRLAYVMRLKQDRPSTSREQFVEWFIVRGLRASVAETVHDYVQQRCPLTDVPLFPEDPLERMSGIVVHEEIDAVLGALGYSELEASEWDALDWDTLDLPPPSEPEAPIASLVYLVNALEERRRTLRRSSPNAAC